MVVEVYYAFLSSIFSPILALPRFFGEVIFTAIITLGLVILFKRFADHKALAAIKTEMKTTKDKIKELQKTNPDEANKLLNESMKLANKQMSLSMKPLMISMLFVILLLPWMATPNVFGSVSVNLPFNLPFAGSALDWFWWYFILSIPLNTAFRKFLGVEV